MIAEQQQDVKPNAVLNALSASARICAENHLNDQIMMYNFNCGRMDTPIGIDYKIRIHPLHNPSIDIARYNYGPTL
jgi:hypothetical protein